ncbi:MAG: hypothetical protein ABEH58_01280, partial [Haloplanus sp.]
APVDRVADILADNAGVASLLDNDWLSLTVVDPEQDHRAFHYAGDLAWTPVSDRTKPAAPSVADG